MELLNELAAMKDILKNGDDLSYRVPPPAFTKLIRAEHPSPTLVVLQNDLGVPIEIEYLCDVGWSIELRYDALDNSRFRQPFTGAQQQLEHVTLYLDETEREFVITVGEQQLAFDKESGKFSAASAGKVYFESNSQPFSRHREPITIYDGIASAKVTDHALRSPQMFTKPTYTTEMLRFSYPRPEGVVLGLPGQTGEFNRNGYRFELYNTDTFTHTPNRPPMYQSWPILFSRSANSIEWFGIFHDNPSRTFVDLGEFNQNEISFESLTNNTRIYLWHGATLAEVARRCARLTGPIAELPNWAFGYQQCRWSYMSTAEIRSVVHRMHQNQFPCDAIYFDIDYMDGFRVFTNDTENFADLEKTVNSLREQNGVYSVAIVDPGVKIDDRYAAYKRLISEGRSLTSADGAPAVMKCWAGESLLPDFFAMETKALWKEMLAQWVEEFGMHGVWNDMNEPANFDGQNAASSQMHSARGLMERSFNLYGYEMSKASAAGLKAALKTTPGLVISRAGYPGVQQHAVIWHGDNCAWWEHLRLALDTTVQYALTGAFFTGADLPGFTGNPPDDLAVRFYQLGAFLPLFRGHSRFFERDKEPYAFGETAQGLIREAINIRYSLIAEWLSAFNRARRESFAPILPSVDKEGLPIRDQFELFGKLLFAPIIERDQRQRPIYLPAGEWFRFGDNKNRLAGDQWLLEAVHLGSVPLFVRAGSTLTLHEPKLTVKQTLASATRLESY